MPLQFNVMHVLPQKNIPFENLPLDRWVANYIAQMKRRERIESQNESRYDPAAEANRNTRQVQE